MDISDVERDVLRNGDITDIIEMIRYLERDSCYSIGDISVELLQTVIELEQGRAEVVATACLRLYPCGILTHYGDGIPSPTSLRGT